MRRRLALLLGSHLSLQLLNAGLIGLHQTLVARRVDQPALQQDPIEGPPRQPGHELEGTLKASVVHQLQSQGQLGEDLVALVQRSGSRQVLDTCPST